MIVTSTTATRIQENIPSGGCPSTAALTCSTQPYETALCLGSKTVQKSKSVLWYTSFYHFLWCRITVAATQAKHNAGLNAVCDKEIKQTSLKNFLGRGGSSLPSLTESNRLTFTGDIIIKFVCNIKRCPPKVKRKVNTATIANDINMRSHEINTRSED